MHILFMYVCFLLNIISNEEIFFQDTPALGTVIVRHCGYTAVVNVKGKTQKGMSDFHDILIDDLPDGGANALNLNRSVPPRFLIIYLYCTLFMFMFMFILKKYFIVGLSCFHYFMSINCEPNLSVVILVYIYNIAMLCKIRNRELSHNFFSSLAKRQIHMSASHLLLCTLVDNFICSLRVQLHRSYNVGKSGENQPSQLDSDDLESFRCTVQELVKINLTKLEEKRVSSVRPIRWELGSCWVQHLQKKENEVCGKPATNDETELSVKGLGNKFKVLKSKTKKSDNISTMKEEDIRLHKLNGEADLGQKSIDKHFETELKELISEEAFYRLKETGTGLHLKVF